MHQHREPARWLRASLPSASLRRRSRGPARTPERATAQIVLIAVPAMAAGVALEYSSIRAAAAGGGNSSATASGVRFAGAPARSGARRITRRAR